MSSCNNTTKSVSKLYRYWCIKQPLHQRTLSIQRLSPLNTDSNNKSSLFFVNKPYQRNFFASNNNKTQLSPTEQSSLVDFLDSVSSQKDYINIKSVEEQEKEKQQSTIVDSPLPDTLKEKISNITQHLFLSINSNNVKEIQKSLIRLTELKVNYAQPLYPIYQHALEYCLSRQEQGEQVDHIIDTIIKFTTNEKSKINFTNMYFYNIVMGNENLVNIFQDHLDGKEKSFQFIITQNIIHLSLLYNRYDIALEWYLARVNRYKLPTFQNLNNLFRFYHKEKNDQLGEKFWTAGLVFRKGQSFLEKEWNHYRSLDPYKIVQDFQIFAGFQSFVHNTSPVIPIQLQKVYFDLEIAIKEKKSSIVKKILMRDIYPKKLIPPKTLLIDALILYIEANPKEFLKSTKVPEYIKPLMGISPLDLSDDIESGVQNLISCGNYSPSVSTHNSILQGLFNTENYEITCKYLIAMFENGVPITSLKMVSSKLVENYSNYKDYIKSLLPIIQSQTKSDGNTPSYASNLFLKHALEITNQMPKDQQKGALDKLLENYKRAPKDQFSMRVGIDILAKIHPVPPTENLDHWEQVFNDQVTRFKDSDSFYLQFLFEKLLSLNQEALVIDYVEKDPTCLTTSHPKTLLDYFETIQKDHQKVIDRFLILQYHPKKIEYPLKLAWIILKANKIIQNPKVKEIIEQVFENRSFAKIDKITQLSTSSLSYLNLIIKDMKKANKPQK
ncbi:hypothetical protein CYY_001566 [Polysphondylium violaceum]|uniref:Uncharacterized protein n=1 Tax=Polysphondylium violaceum TaxID=133409 RepID=A0A8J4Q1K7_9MYCE|nr:hypothetical protein CYY_001566 [Polysphondylium violaceum]